MDGPSDWRSFEPGLILSAFRTQYIAKKFKLELYPCSLADLITVLLALGRLAFEQLRFEKQYALDERTFRSEVAVKM